jgi:hypothetical protein
MKVGADEPNGHNGYFSSLKSIVHFYTLGQHWLCLQLFERQQCILRLHGVLNTTASLSAASEKGAKIA